MMAKVIIDCEDMDLAKRIAFEIVDKIPLVDGKRLGCRIVDGK